MTVQTSRALIIGDSLAGPRPKRGQHLNDTWPVILKRRFPQIDFWQRCRATALSWDVIKEYNLFSDSIDAFDYLIVQIGIGDCCPRPYPYTVEKFFRAFLPHSFVRQINKHYGWMLKFRSRPFTTKEQFANNFKLIAETSLERNPRIKVIVIAIGQPCHDLAKKAPGILKNYELYNTALREYCEQFNDPSRLAFVDPYAHHNVDEIFLDDGHHLTTWGHTLVADATSQLIATSACSACTYAL